MPVVEVSRSRASRTRCAASRRRLASGFSLGIGMFVVRLRSQVRHRPRKIGLKSRKNLKTLLKTAL